MDSGDKPKPSKGGGQAGALAGYVIGCVAHLETVDDAAILAGSLSFPDPAAYM